MAEEPVRGKPMPRLVPLIAYAAVSIAVLGPLLLPGYVLTLDMVFSPRIKLEDWFYGLRTDIWGELPAWALISAMGKLVPVWLVQKLVLFAILLLAGYSAHRLSPARTMLGKYFCGLLYVLNPFVYVRFMAGQWQFLMGYALAPLAIKSLIALAERPRLKEAVVAAATLSLLGLFSPHMMVMLAVAGLVILLVHAIPLLSRPGERQVLARHARFSAVFIAMVAALSFYWFLPAFAHKSAFLYQISRADLQVFSAKPLEPGGSVFWALASLHGFWRGGTPYVTEMLPGWYLVPLVLIFLAVHGFINRHPDDRHGRMVKAVGVIGIAALLLGSGISSPLFSPVYEFMFNKLFFLRAFRDSQKLVSLLVLAYAYLGALGVEEIYYQIKPRLNRPEFRRKAAATGLVIAVLALPFAYSMNMLWGFRGQLRPVQYPVEWREANNFLNQQPGDFTVLFLPWHGFMAFSWAGQKVATPARWFFDKPVLQGENIEVGPIDTESTDPAQHYVGFLVRNRDRIKNLGELLAPLNIKYIMLVKETDYKEYDFLSKQTDLKVIVENANLVLFENLHPVAMFYSVEQTQRLSDWNQWLQASARMDIDSLGAVFSLAGNTPASATAEGTLQPTAGFHPIAYRKHSPARYELEAPPGKFVVTSLSFEPAWRLDGASPSPNLDLTNSFDSPTHVEPVLLYYSRYAILLLGYGVSIAGVAAAVILWLLSNKRAKLA